MLFLAPSDLGHILCSFFWSLHHMLNMFEARKILCMPSAKYLELLLSCIPHTPTAATLSNPMNLGKTSHTHFKDAKTFTFNRIYEDGSCCWTGGTCADGRHQQCEDARRLKKHTHTYVYTHIRYTSFSNVSLALGKQNLLKLSKDFHLLLDAKSLLFGLSSHCCCCCQANINTLRKDKVLSAVSGRGKGGCGHIWYVKLICPWCGDCLLLCLGIIPYIRLLLGGLFDFLSPLPSPFSLHCSLLMFFLLIFPLLFLCFLANTRKHIRIRILRILWEYFL